MSPTEPAFDGTHVVVGVSHPQSPSPQICLSIRDVVAIQQHKLWLESEGYRAKTVRSSISNMKSLARRCDIDDPDSVKAEIARRLVTESTKQKLVYAYNRYCKHHSIQWTKPRYKRVDKLPYVPSEKDIEQLIGGMSKRLGTILRFMMETGCRLGEMWCVEWRDLDSKRNIVSINQPEKGSLARNLRLSSRLVTLINQLARKSKFIFRTKDESCKERILSYFWQKRKETAQKVNNPNLMRINFKTLRHFKASQEYYKTKDILHVKRILGHKNIKNTLVYTHLLELEGDESYVVKVASSIEEFTNLLELGFEYISDYES